MSLRRRLIFGALRLAAVGAVALGEPPAAAAPPDTESPEGEPFPAGIDAAAWKHQVFQQIPPLNSEWTTFKVLLATTPDRGQIPGVAPLPQPIAGFLADYLAGTPADAAGLRAALDAAEAAHLWDARLVGLIWEASAAADPAALPELYARLERHARVAAALTLAAAETDLPQQRPWMSKAARPREWSEVPASAILPERPDLVETARRLWPTVDAGPWRYDFRLSFAVVGAATLHRAGRASPAGTGDALGRLDVLVAGPGGARIVIPGPRPFELSLAEGAALTWWNAHTYLDDGEREALRLHIRFALDGDPFSLRTLYDLACMAWPIIEQETGKNPDAPGAAALRLLTALYRE